MATHALTIAQRRRLLNPKAYRRPDHRQSAAARGYDRDWQRLRDAYLKAHPLCERCGKEPADTVHHIKPVETHPELRLVWENLESMGRVCHEQFHGRATPDIETADQPQDIEIRSVS